MAETVGYSDSQVAQGFRNAETLFDSICETQEVCEEMKEKKTKAQITEERILEAAINLFSEKGYSGTSTGEIARDANVAEGTIFRYFPQKKDLLVRGITKFIDLFGEQVVILPLEKIYAENMDATPEQLLKKIIMNRLELIDRMGDNIRVMLTEIQYHDEVRDVFLDRIAGRGVQYGKKVFEHFVKTGFFRDDIQTFIAFRCFLGTIMIMALQRKVYPQATENPLPLEDEVDMVIDIMLNGMRKRGGAANE